MFSYTYLITLELFYLKMAQTCMQTHINAWRVVFLCGRKVLVLISYLCPRNGDMILNSCKINSSCIYIPLKSVYNINKFIVNSNYTYMALNL